MIEFDRGQNHRVGKIVQELRTLIEERGVVFVAFQNEVPALPETETAAKVLCNSADEKRGLESGGFEDPCQHRRGGRFAVRSGNDQNFFPYQKFVMQDLRQRAEWDTLVEQALQFDVAAGKRVADDDEVGTWIQVGFGKRLRNGNSKRFEKCGHRRIGGRVGAGDVEAALFQHAGQRSHRGAADADEMDVFGLAFIRAML